MHPYKLILAYDGTRYFGWQKTKMGPSIQESLQSALKTVCQEPILPEAASRTDRGVHAEAQVVSFSLKKQWEPSRLLRALNGKLAPDIRVKEAAFAPEGFHPTLHAVQKEYRYHFCLGPVQDPVHRLYSWDVLGPVSLDRMRAGARDLLGTHDFTSFANLVKKDPFCRLDSIDLIPLADGRLQISIAGNRFLYKMARNLAGTLYYIGRGKLDPGSIPAILKSKDRKKAGISAPARGLTLYRLSYSL